MRPIATRNHWKPLIICPHLAMSREIRTAMDDLGVTDVYQISVYPRAGAAAGIAAQHSSNICFLDVSSHQEQALHLIGEIAPIAPVVALNPLNDADFILRCLRRGACEFLSDPTAEQLNGVLERLALLRVPADPVKSAIVYCVVPGKAGCGASTLAAYLAIDMSRSAGAKVLLVDTDCLTASLAFLLKLKYTFHLADAVRDCLRMDQDLWSRLVTACHGIDVLPAPEDPSAGVVLDRPAAIELICFWREHYEAVVLDVAGAYALGSDLATLSDEILVVTTNELASLHATRRSIENLEQSGVDRSRLKLLVTRYTPATGLKSDDVETALKLSPYALLNNDYQAVQAAILEGQPVAAGSAFGRSIHSLTERLLGLDKALKKRSRLFGLIPARA
jgi:Flp pilus assembly CpaE family ATPase